MVPAVGSCVCEGQPEGLKSNLQHGLVPVPWGLGTGGRRPEHCNMKKPSLLPIDEGSRLQ